MNKWRVFSRRESDHTVVQGDMTLLMAIMFLLVLILIFPFIYDPETKDPDKTPFESVAEWDGESPVDIDTWVWCTNPGTGLWEIVSYQNKKGKFLVLNQDDRGFRPEYPADNINKEVVISLGNRLPAALCGVNMHVYGTNGGALPIDVAVSVILFKGHESGKQVILADKRVLTMKRVNEEITVVSFEIDASGNFVVGSNEMTVQMRCASSFGKNCSPE